MYPILIDLGRRKLPLFGETDLFLPTYGLLFATAVMIAWIWFMRRTERLGLPTEKTFNLGFYTVLIGLLGAKLTLIALNWQYYLSRPARILETLRSAGVLMGGVLAAALFFAWYSRRHALPVRRLLDAAAAPLALAQGIGRLGCFCAGCCYGAAADPDGWFHVVFEHRASEAPTGVPLIPIQLLQFVADVALAGVLVLIGRRKLAAGTVFWLYLVLYSLSRGTIEFWRGDRHRGVFFGETISTSQIFSLVAFLTGLTLLILDFRRRSRAAG